MLTPFTVSIALVIEDTIRQASGSHILTTSEERTNVVEEYRRSAVLSHAAQDLGNLVKLLSEVVEQGGHAFGIVLVNSLDHVEHLMHQFASFRFDGNGDHVEPFFVFGSSERCDETQGIGVTNVGLPRRDFKVPEAHCGIGSAGRQFQVSTHLQQGACNALREFLPLSASIFINPGQHTSRGC